MKFNIPLPPEFHTPLDEFFAGPSKPPLVSPSANASASSTPTIPGGPTSASGVVSSVDDMRSEVQSSQSSDYPRSSPDNSTRYWEEGYYVWMARSHHATLQHLITMRMNLRQQASLLQNKEKSNEIWAKAAARNRETLWYPHSVYGKIVIPDNGRDLEQPLGEEIRPKGRKGMPFPEMQ